MPTSGGPWVLEDDVGGTGETRQTGRAGGTEETWRQGGTRTMGRTGGTWETRGPNWRSIDNLRKVTLWMNKRKGKNKQARGILWFGKTWRTKDIKE